MMRRLMRMWAVPALGAMVLVPSAAGAGGPTSATLTPAALVGVSLHGSIVVFAASGSRRADVTHSGQDHGPVVAPNGRAIAFWRGPLLPTGTARRRVMMARPNGHGGWSVAPFSRPVSAIGSLEGPITWAPGSQAVAWFDGSAVQYRRENGRQRTVLSIGSWKPAEGPLALAFSRDGSTIAATLPPSGAGLPRTLRVAVRRISVPRQRTITIHFRPGVLIGANGRGSAPVTDDLAYTTSQLALPGHTLQFATISAPGIGRQMTGVFLVPDTGGRARLVQGNGHGLHSIPPFGYGMNGATHFELAPNGRYTATDPTGGFYVAGQIGPFHVVVPTPTGCVLSQWTWLADSVHLAYVTMCVVPGSTPIRLRLTLATVSIFGGAPTVLYRTISSNPNVVDLAPGYRCVACG